MSNIKSIDRFLEDGKKGTICLKRQTTRIKFKSGAWADITRYWYADSITTSAVGSAVGMHYFKPHTWGMWHSFRTPRVFPSANEGEWLSVHLGYDGKVFLVPHLTRETAELLVSERAKDGYA
jgi:hypothetical protein